MNPHSNELINEDRYKALSDDLRRDFKPVPNRLQRFAENELNGEESVIVPDDNSPLAKWARRLRIKLGQKP